jgi:hypothetical protein
MGRAVHVTDPLTVRNTSHTDHMCLFIIDQSGRAIEFDPLGVTSPVKVMSKLAFDIMRSAYVDVVGSSRLIERDDTTMFKMASNGYNSAIWCIYIAFHTAINTLAHLKTLDADELDRDFKDFTTLFSQHIAVAIVILYKHTNNVVDEINTNGTSV